MNSDSEVNHLKCDLKASDQNLNQIVAELGGLGQQNEEPAKHMVLMKDQLSKQTNKRRR